MKRLAFPQQATIRDTTVREGFQREERLIPTSAKLWVVEQLILAGFRRLEVTNFANPKRLPQFADAEELLRQVHNHRSITHLLESVELTAITINHKAVARAVAARRNGYGPDTDAGLGQRGRPTGQFRHEHRRLLEDGRKLRPAGSKRRHHSVRRHQFHLGLSQGWPDGYG